MSMTLKKENICVHSINIGFCRNKSKAPKLTSVSRFRFNDKTLIGVTVKD